MLYNILSFKQPTNHHRPWPATTNDQAAVLLTTFLAAQRPPLPVLSAEAGAVCVCAWAIQSLEVEPLGDVALLAVERPFLGLEEIVLGHAHAPLAEGQQPRLSAHSLDVRPRQVVLGHDEHLGGWGMRKLYTGSGCEHMGSWGTIVLTGN